MERIVLYAELATHVSQRAGALLLALAAAAPVDARLAQIWEVSRLQRLGGAAAVAADIAGKAVLTVSPDEARDLIWSLNSPELHHLLVHDRGWAPQRFSAWLAAALCGSLLLGNGCGGTAARPRVDDQRSVLGLERVADRDHLDLRLAGLGVGIGVGDDAAARRHPDRMAGDGGAP
ncbi:hypothetical protein ABIB25_001705 [Nakamurella sp. UYEF19]